MNVTDLIIIYFACGSPLGVYYFTCHKDDLSLRAVLGMLIRFLIWPLSALPLIRNRFFSSNPPAEASLDRKTGYIRAELENIAFSESDASSIFEFREVISRFVALTTQAKIIPAEKRGNEVFAVSGHKNATLAAACLARRNRERILFHQTQARNDFVEVISDMARNRQNGHKIARLALALVELLGDRESVDDLSVLVSGISNGENVKDMVGLEKAIWKPKTYTASALR